MAAHPALALRHVHITMLVIYGSDCYSLKEIAGRILRVGARGYVMKETAADALIKAAGKVFGGGIYLRGRMAGQMLELVAGQGKQASTSPLDRLTDPEFESCN